MARKHRPSQKEIAREAGVSQSVVSHVLNDNQNVSISLATRERVKEAMERLGYIPNRAAQTLRLQKTYTIAAIIPDITNPYYPAYVRGIQDVLVAANYDLVVYNSDGYRHLEERALRAAVRSHVDGIIGMLFHTTLDDFRRICGDEKPAAINVVWEIPEDISHLPIDTVSIDGVAAGRKVTQYLIDKGHRRIAILSGLEMTPPRESRLQGYLDALKENGLITDEVLVFDGEFNEHGGYDSMSKALAVDPLPDAVFAANDLMAIGAINACRERGIEVPGDIAIAGFDDIPAASLLHPALTTIDQNALLTGQRAAELLLERLTGTYEGPTRYEEIPVQLVVRDSA